jgi:iron only hydrogenase large subunit-like protein
MSTSLNHSGNSVILDNVDDYLAPSQACINPLFQPSASDQKDGEQPSKNDGENETQSAAVVVPRRRRRRKIQQPLNTENDSTSTSMPTPSQEKNKEDVVKASMADCLACSGCVTTAETVLIEQQHSLSSLRDRLQKQNDGNLRSRIITISPNSWADLCRHWKLKSDSDNYYFYTRFTTLLSQILSAQVVVDGNVPLQWTWIDEAEEFCNVYRASSTENDNNTSTTATPFPSVAIDFTKTQIFCPDGTTKILDASKPTQNGASDKAAPTLPLISGSCPALVCLVEKTLTNLVPHLSQTVSPMSMVGMVLKGIRHHHGKIVHWDHWAIMPCHDKKLEASRKDFYITGADRNQQGVDLVISTKECVELVEEWIKNQIDPNDGNQHSLNVAKYLESLPASDLCSSVMHPMDLAPKTVYHTTDHTKPLLVAALTLQQIEAGKPEEVTLQKQMAFASGGHANFIFHYAASKLFGCNAKDLNVEWKAASLISKNVKSARLARQRKQHFYQAKLYRYSDGSYNCNRNSGVDATPVLNFAIAHGMQTMHRALKMMTNDSQGIHYLEAMACPHGCVNGGGSARSQSTSGVTIGGTMIRETPTETQLRVQKTLEELRIPSPPVESPLSDYSLHRTTYHVVPPMQYSMGATAGVQVDKMQW